MNKRKATKIKSQNQNKTNINVNWYANKLNKSCRCNSNNYSSNR